MSGWPPLSRRPCFFASCSKKSVTSAHSRSPYLPNIVSKSFSNQSHFLSTTTNNTLQMHLHSCSLTFWQCGWAERGAARQQHAWQDPTAPTRASRPETRVRTTQKTGRKRQTKTQNNSNMTNRTLRTSCEGVSRVPPGTVPGESMRYTRLNSVTYCHTCATTMR